MRRRRDIHIIELKLFTRSNIPYFHQLFDKLFYLSSIWRSKLIFPTTQEMVFQKLCVYPFEESNCCTYLHGNICTVKILIKHLLKFDDHTLCPFQWQSNILLVLRGNHSYRKRNELTPGWGTCCYICFLF